MALVALELLKRWWREGGLLACLVALVILVPRYYSVSGALKACQETTAHTKVKIVYKEVAGKPQPCPDVEIDTGAQAAASEGKKESPKVSEWPIRLDAGFDIKPETWDNAGGEIGASFGPFRGYTRYNGSFSVGIGYIHVFKGGAD